MMPHKIVLQFRVIHVHLKGPGDYMNEAPPGDYIREKTNEKKASFGCPIGEDTCDKDSGLPNPIHNFMSYVDVSFVIFLALLFFLSENETDRIFSAMMHRTTAWVSRGIERGLAPSQKLFPD